MALARNILRTRTLVGSFRHYSSGTKLLDVSVNDENGFATVTMNRPPVNSLNLEFLTEFCNVLTDLDRNKSRGMILTSSSNKVFSAGLDILEMYKPQPERFKAFWNSLQEAWIKLYGASFPTVAVINGHSPAGGCLLAMSCEYRIMLNKFTIGLNETQLGIVAPPWFIKTMQNTISKRDTELALTTGRLFKTEEALKVGLIDEIASDKAQALSQAEAFLNRFEMIPPIARAYTKTYLRGADIQELQKNREKEVGATLSLVAQPKVQQGLEFYLAMLKNKKEAK
ncbi:hypothetical protein ILUMI_26246 [Ignelater luminosus]|uniref:Enoyl-CoA delta isomerase 1, mitochondrial n=1 Tax=Ignelater luminosus TaxID=2038154 RepID=A0A8K0C6U9_IGNLU|nr:hypothetical protein ILUMI_26246 [Ignelater luminosus]